MADGNNHGYELLYIARPDLDDNSVSAINERVAQLIANASGRMENTELWGRRALAYPIQRHMEGNYILHRFEMDPNATDELERLLRFNENVIRFMLLRTDE